MKLKPIYIYLSLIIVALITLVTISSKSGSEETTNISKGNMPDDEVHRSVGENSGIQPSGSNVNSEIIDKMNELEKYVELNPTDTAKVKEYAELLAASHQQDKSLELFERILQIDPRRADILSNLAVLHYNRNEFKNAKSYVEKILAVNPNNTEAIYNLGLIEAKIGDIEAAKKQWEDLLKNHPNTKMSDLAKQSLENL